MSQAKTSRHVINARLACAIAGLTSGTPRELLFNADGGGGGGGGGGAAPAAAPAAPATAAPAALSSAPAEPSADAKRESAAKERSEGLAEPRPRSKEDKKSAAAELREHLEKKRKADDGDDEPAPKPKGEPKPDDKPTGRQPDGKFAAKDPQAQGAPPKPAQAAPAAPATLPAPDNGEHQRRLSAALREQTQARGEAEQHKRENATLKTELQRHKQREEAFRKPDANPHDILDYYGLTLDKVVEATVEKGMKPRSMRAELPAEVRSELDELRAFVNESKQEKQTAEQRRFRAESERVVGDYVKANADQFPFTAALGWGASAVVERAMGLKQADATEALQTFEKQQAAHVASLVGNERVLSALLTSQPKLKDTLVAALKKLGAITSDEGKAPPSKRGADDTSTDGPGSVSDLPSGRTAAPKSRSELKREAAREMRALNERRRQSGDDD